MSSQDDPRLSHFAVSEAGDISFYAVRGGTVRRFQSEASMNAMKRIAPQIIIFCLGGNDIDSSDAHPLRVGMDLFQLASKLKHSIHGLRRVGFCQVVERKRWRQLSVEGGRVAVQDINEFLQAACVEHECFFYWEHKGLAFSRFNIFRTDGVHFSNYGNKKFFRSVRGAILRAVRS